MTDTTIRSNVDSSLSAAEIAPSGWAAFWLSYRRSILGLLGAGILLVLLVLATIGPAIAPFDPESIGVGPAFSPPSGVHWMGTDNLGRDVLSRVLNGCRVSLTVGILAAAASTFIGLLIGAISGYFGGLLDDALMRMTEVFQTIPRFFLAMVAVAFFGANIWNIIFAIAILSWPVTARLARAEYMTLRSREFIVAARVLGVSTTTILVTEILPNAASPVIVNGTLQVAQAMLLEAGLSYLGLGDPNSVSWGLMLYQAQPVLRSAWWMAVFPGLGIFLGVLSLNLVGDTLNDSLNPRLRES
jgi:peptide/nickel transport system permease protein